MFSAIIILFVILFQNYPAYINTNMDCQVENALDVCTLANKYPNCLLHHDVVEHLSLRTTRGEVAEVVKNKDGKGYTIHAMVYIYGAAATWQEAQKRQTQINQFWNRTDANGINHLLRARDGLPVTFNILVQMATIADFQRRGAKNNFALVVSKTVPATDEDNEFAMIGEAMVWDLAQDALYGGTMIPHEIGHLLGFKVSPTAAFGTGGIDGLQPNSRDYDDSHFRYYYRLIKKTLRDEIPNPVPAMSIGVGFNMADRRATQSDINNFGYGRGIMGAGRLFAYPHKKGNFIAD